MNRTEYIGKLNALYVGEKNCLEELITIYDEKDKKIERLNNIIKEALILTEHTRFEEQYASDEILLPILNKLRESGIRNYIKVKGSDKE